MRRNVKIKSIFTGDVWQGSLDLPADDQEALQIIYRCFNRVDEEDISRLEGLGFRQPSVSIGDRVDLDERRYWADSFGWTSSWDDLPKFARALSELRDRTHPEN